MYGIKQAAFEPMNTYKIEEVTTAVHEFLNMHQGYSLRAYLGVTDLPAKLFSVIKCFKFVRLKYSAVFYCRSERLLLGVYV